MFACKACSGSDPTQDTVKFDASAIVAQQQQREREAAEQQRHAAEEARRVEEEAAERKRIEEEQRREQELRRQQEEEQAIRRAAAEEEERKRQEQLAEQRRLDEERLRQESEAARLAGEQQAKERAEREAAQAQVRKTAIESYLKEHGFKNGVSGAKKSMMSTTYPLHAAAKEGNAQMIEMLLREGANAAQKNSSGKTPVQVAEKSNKGSSHAPVLRALAGGAALSVGAGGRAGGC